MQILSDTNLDIRSSKPKPGSYEWWYFDAITGDGEYTVVAIFYDGNPFSRRYIDAIESGRTDLEGQFPAISLSVYKGSSPVFYSFEEVNPDEASFSSSKPEGEVKQNRFYREFKGDKLIYNLELDQQLPNGDRLEGALSFQSTAQHFEMNGGKPSAESEKHRWNLVQPTAEVTGKLSISGFNAQKILFEGTGYHDHNTGEEPMRDSFKEWYWGRVHFPNHTLVYYLMNENGVMESRGWLFGPDRDVQIIRGGIEPEDIGVNIFGLQSARKIEKKEGDAQFLIQKRDLIDDGPFYQRFHSQVMLHTDGEIHQGRGISEYICPSRIHVKLFRPLVNMRIRYPGKDHWVQKSPRLYRWTW